MGGGNHLIYLRATKTGWMKCSMKFVGLIIHMGQIVLKIISTGKREANNVRDLFILYRTSSTSEHHPTFFNATFKWLSEDK